MAEVLSDIAITSSCDAIRRGRCAVDWNPSKYFMQERLSSNNKNGINWRNSACVQHGFCRVILRLLNPASDTGAQNPARVNWAASFPVLRY